VVSNKHRDEDLRDVFDRDQVSLALLVNVQGRVVVVAPNLEAVFAQVLHVQLDALHGGAVRLVVIDFDVMRDEGFLEQAAETWDVVARRILSGHCFSLDIITKKSRHRHL